MKTFRYLTIAVLGLVMAACSSDIASEQPVVSHQGKGIPFTATISMRGSATRSVMTESTSTISAAWETGDELALVYEVSGQKQVTKATMTVSDDKSATITATIAEGVTTGTTVKLLYPYSRVCDDPAEAATYGTISEDALAGQDGTLETIANDYDLCQGDGEFTLMSDGTASLKADVTMASQIAIWKLSLSDGTNAIKATQVNIVKGEDELMVMVMPEEGTFSEFYVAVPAVSNGTINIWAATSEGDYTYTKTGVTLEAGKYYQSAVTMTASVNATYRVYTAKDTYTDETIPSTATTLTGTVTPGNLAAGTYVVSGTATCAGDLTLTGDVDLILEDDASLTMTGGITGGGYTLNIFGQTEGTGELSAQGSSSGGIAIVTSNLNVHGGKITISTSDQGIETGSTFTMYNGTINTTGTSNGIMALGPMKVYGGEITASSTSGAAISLDKGSSNDNCNLTIAGGKVTATNTGSAAGIEANEELLISGGTVEAQGGDQMEGIISYDEISISGGTVTAKGGAGGGIGLEGTTTIFGGTVTAIGGNGVAGGTVDDGAAGYDGTLKVNGGTLIATGGEKADDGNDGPGLSGSVTLVPGMKLYTGIEPNPSTDPVVGPQTIDSAPESRYVIIKE